MAVVKQAERVQASQTAWERLRAMSDEDIKHAVDADPDASPIPTPDELNEYKPARVKR